MPISLEQFEKSTSDSGLLTEAELRRFRDETKPPPTNAEELAAALVDAKKLTAFQAARIAEGKADSLVFHEYVVLDKIGEGGMGEVYKARHRRMKRYVAIKAISQKAVDSPKAIARFHREVEAAAQLDHPNIVAAFDAFESGGQHYLIMKYVEGHDLSTMVRGGRKLTVDQAVDVITQAARGLAYAHEQGVVHRDIKPSNLLLDSAGTVKILDMGLARIDYVPTEDDSTQQLELTGVGQVMGTADYMAPEQALDTHKADERSDIYSLGCTLYRLITGKVPFEGTTAVEKIVAHREQPIPSLCELVASVPGELDAIYAQMVAKKSDDRQQSMTEVIEQLEALVPVSSASSTSAVAETATWQGNIDDEPSEAPSAADSGSRMETATGQYSERTQEVTPSTLGGKKKRRVAWIGGCALLALAIVAPFTVPSWFGGEKPVAEDPPNDEKRKAPAIPVAHDGQNYALEFDGKSSYITTPLRCDSSEALTIEVWVKPAQVAGYMKTVVSDLEGGGVGIATQNGHWVFATHDGADYRTTKSKDPAVNRQKVHVAGVWDGNEQRLFVGGTLQSTDAASSTRKASPLPIMIGCSPGNPKPSFGEAFNGIIDEVRISNVARYDKEFTPSKRHEPDEHTLALYHFDEGRGDRVLDSSGNGHHGKIHGKVKWIEVVDDQATTSSFMGLNTTGNRICIVADCSQRMAGRRFERLKIEVLKMVDSMKDSARFQLVFFQGDPLPLPKDTWLDPRSDREEVVKWLAKIEPTGGVDQNLGVRAAFQLNPPPDQIYFMTGGKGSASLYGDFKKHNSALGEKSARVSTISLDAGKGDPYLKRIAEESGGEHMHVPQF